MNNNKKSKKYGFKMVKIFEKEVWQKTVSLLCSPYLIQPMESCDIMNKNMFVYIWEFGYRDIYYLTE